MAANIIVITILAIAVGFAIRSIVHNSKSNACGGCPYSAACSKCADIQKMGKKDTQCACSVTQDKG